MSLIERMLKYDKCVYWAPKGKNQFGKPLFENPVELGCRWEDRKSRRMDATGVEQIFNGKVFVGIDLDLDGVLWHGLLIDVPVDGDPSIPPDDVQIIAAFDKVGKIRNDKFVRTAFF